MDDHEKIEAILAWADDHEDFDTSFVMDLSEKLDEFGTLTPGQSQALDNIMDKWNIE